MESSGVGALAAHAVPLPDPAHTPEPLGRVTHPDNTTTNDAGAGATDAFLGGSEPGYHVELDTPLQTYPPNPFEASNVRETVEPHLQQLQQQLQSSPTSTDAANAANILAGPTQRRLSALDAFPPADGPAAMVPEAAAAADYGLNGPYGLNGAVYDDAAVAEGWVGADGGNEWQPAELMDDRERENMQAYAKLVFPDGDFYVTTLQVTVGRDMEFYRNWLRRFKRRQKEHGAHALDEPVDQAENAQQTQMGAEAEQALRAYQAEPSQPSLADEGERNVGGPSSKSSQSLVGHPAKALPSNYSEQGGAVSFAVSDDESEGRRARRRRRRNYNSKSSSTTSVVPANLHPSMMSDLGDYSNPFVTDPGRKSFIPIHPIAGQEESIKKISKEHLQFSYNMLEERWELKVLGKRAAVNGQNYGQGHVIPLDHQTEIEFAGIVVTFKLPDARRGSPGLSRGTFASGDEEDADELDEASKTTPAADSDDERNVAGGKNVGRKKPIPVLRLGVKKKPTSQKEKDKEGEKPAKPPKEGEKSEQSPEALKKPEKGKKPKEPSTTSPELLKEEPPSTPGPGPPAPAEPGSVFEGVAAEDMPEKRKGPGRPPKNGLVSKRDMGFIKKKLKEYEKRGLPAPAMHELVQMVRAENKLKEAAAKAAARGEAPPESSIVQSIETDVSLAAPHAEPIPTVYDAGDQLISATPAEPPRKPSPKPKRVARSPSPMKPESEYTEDELKKPSATYVVILDEILRTHPQGQADLQEIYDRICKKFPYFKYRSGTHGWQSSVRHNLLQHDRFKENGRSGKGKLWAINYEVPLEKEKKRRVTPPPRPPMAPMQNGQFPPYGQPNYNPPFGQPGMNGQPPYNAGASGSYYSPYAPSQHGVPGPYGAPPGQPGAGPMPPMGQPQHGMAPHRSQYTPSYPHQQPGSGTPQAPTPQPRQSGTPAPFQNIVQDIMAYRAEYLSHFPKDEGDQRADFFQKCTAKASDYFHGNSGDLRPESEEEGKVLEKLKDIFEKHAYLKQKLKSATPAETGPSEGAAVSAPPTGQNAAAEMTAHVVSSAPDSAAVPAPMAPMAPMTAQDGLSGASSAPPPPPPAVEEKIAVELPAANGANNAPTASENGQASAAIGDPAPQENVSPVDVSSKKRTAEDGESEEQEAKRIKTE